MALSIEARELSLEQLAERLDFVEEVAKLMAMAEESYHSGGFAYAKAKVNSDIRDVYKRDFFQRDAPGRMTGLIRYFMENCNTDEYLTGINIDHDYNWHDGASHDIVSMELSLNTPDYQEEEQEPDHESQFDD